MGAYLNPVAMDKEEWLEHFGVRMPDGMTREDYEDIPRDQMLVCLVNNGSFVAAGIAFDEREFASFADPTDHRPKKWWMVPTEKLMGASNLRSYI